MKSIRLFPCLLSLLALLCASRAEAQYQSPGFFYSPPPRTSPFLNLLRSGTPPGINYYGLVRPEIEFRRGIQQLQGQALTQQQAITGLQTAPAAVTTGHPVGFGTHLSYFQNLSSPGATAFTTGTTQQRATGAAGTTSPPPSRRR
jgi:hypothetical protein